MISHDLPGLPPPSTPFRQVGTPLYSAPEVMRREPYDQSCDVWSYGCLLVALATRAHPYASVDVDERAGGARPGWTREGERESATAERARGERARRTRRTDER